MMLRPFCQTVAVFFAQVMQTLKAVSSFKDQVSRSIMQSAVPHRETAHVRLTTRNLKLGTAFVLALAAWNLNLETLHAQSTNATLSGQITDPTGKVVPNTEVQAVNIDTNVATATKTNGDGLYVILSLIPGRYRLVVRHEGFKVINKTDIVLNVQDTLQQNFALEVGSTSESVTVEGGGVNINTADAAVSTVVDHQFVENIPLNGRSFQSLINLTPGVVEVPSGTNQSGQFSVNGQRDSANSFMVDGVSANFGASPGVFGQTQSSGNLPGLTTFGTTQSLVSVDALQEFKVQTSTYSAEYGRQPGGQISIVTRSGTNQFHGSAFDYLRNDAFDANDWFADQAGEPKAEERQNDFGGTVGGSVFVPGLYNGRDHTFFFFSYEGLRLHLPEFSLTNVPTMALRQQAPVGMQPILNAFPIPNGSDLGDGLAEFKTGYSDPSTLDAASIRIDQAVNDRLTLFARYNRAPSQSVTKNIGSVLSGVTSSRLATQTITLGATVSVTPKAINELRLNYSGNGAYLTRSQDSFGGATPPARSALIPPQYDSGPTEGDVLLIFPGFTSNSVPGVLLSGLQVTSQRQFNLLDNFSYGVGSHQFKFGAYYRRLTPMVGLDSYQLLSIFFSQQDVAAGTASSGFVQASLPMRPVFLNFSAYVQDAWKLSRRLTLDLGMRWDVNPAPTEENGHNPAVVTEISNLATMQLAPLGTKQWKTTYYNFAPRFGAVYQLSKRPGKETVVRGGFGLFYDTGNDFGAFNFNQGFPYYSYVSLSSVSYPLSPAQVAPAPLPIQTGLIPPYSNFTAFDPHLKLPRTLQWSIAAQQALSKNQAITLSYVGAAGRSLLQDTFTNLSEINPNFTGLFIYRNSATSDYDALQAQFQRHLSKGLQALVSYTWSHTLDDDSTSRSERVAQRGNADFDLRHVFAAAATYEIPPLNENLLSRAIFGHWSIDTSVHAQSALPVDLVASTVTDPTDGSLVNVRPDRVPGVPLYLYSSSFPGGRAINAAAFSLPTTGQSGDSGRNQVRGLGAWQIDTAIHREFTVHESLALQFRAEAFNLFNHPNFGDIQTQLSAANFGQATDMLNRQLGGISQLYQIGGPRSLQLALKLVF